MTVITSAEIKKRLSQQPFLPFRIVTSTGRHYDVLRPDSLMVTNRMLAIGRVKVKGDEEFDAIHVVPVLGVIAIEALPAKSKKK
jgi:hypothetical protein